MTGSPTLGEIFNPARDCTDIVDQLPDVEDGFYWIGLPEGTKHKVCVWITSCPPIRLFPPWDAFPPVNN
jgi:hypothetical protein